MLEGHIGEGSKVPWSARNWLMSLACVTKAGALATRSPLTPQRSRMPAALGWLRESTDRIAAGISNPPSVMEKATKSPVEGSQSITFPFSLHLV